MFKTATLKRDTPEGILSWFKGGKGVSCSPSLSKPGHSGFNDVICKIKSWVMDEKKHVRSVAIGTARRLVKIQEWVDSRDPRASVIPLGGSLQSQRQDKRSRSSAPSTRRRVSGARSSCCRSTSSPLGPMRSVHGPVGSACPPPAAGDKEPAHCACLICVTEVVCAKIDVAFHSAVCGPRGGLLLPVCLSLLSPARQQLQRVLHEFSCCL
ncbi:uncharacterized protein LOC120834281 isoform X2 [Gasterosteus aculeatus]